MCRRYDVARLYDSDVISILHKVSSVAVTTVNLV